MDFTDLFPLKEPPSRGTVDPRSIMLREPNLLIPLRSPNGYCVIDKESALFKRLKPDWVFGPQPKAYWPEVNGPMFSPLVGGSFGGSPAGKAMRGNGGTSDGFVSNLNVDFLSNASSLSGYVLAYSPTTEGVLVCRWGNPTPGYGGFHTFWLDNQLLVLVARSTDSNYWTARKTASATAGLNGFGFSWNGAPNPDTQEVYLNGKSDNGAYWFQKDTNNIQTVSYPLYVCKQGDGGGDKNTHVLFCALKANAIWTAEDHAAIHADPFSMVKPA